MRWDKKRVMSFPNAISEPFWSSGCVCEMKNAWSSIVTLPLGAKTAYAKVHNSHFVPQLGPAGCITRFLSHPQAHAAAISTSASMHSGSSAAIDSAKIHAKIAAHVRRISGRPKTTPPKEHGLHRRRQEIYYAGRQSLALNRLRHTNGNHRDSGGDVRQNSAST